MAMANAAAVKVRERLAALSQERIAQNAAEAGIVLFAAVRAGSKYSVAPKR